MINVLSLFDGMACGLTALKRAGIPVATYYASEVDKYAIQIAKKNHPEILHLGDVTGWRSWTLPRIDLIIGGSPCQGFSFAGKQLNFDDPRSALFFEFVNCVTEFRPRWFLLENVKMKQSSLGIISEALGVGWVRINSSLVSGQLRDRFYWANWDIPQPKDLGILYQNILQRDEARKEKAYTLTATYYKKGGEPTRQRNFKKAQRPIAWVSDTETRWLAPIECERLQTLPDNYTEGVSNTQRYKMLGNGWTVDVIAHILRSLPNV